MKKEIFWCDTTVGEMLQRSRFNFKIFAYLHFHRWYGTKWKQIQKRVLRRAD